MQQNIFNCIKSHNFQHKLVLDPLDMIKMKLRVKLTDFVEINNLLSLLCGSEDKILLFIINGEKLPISDENCKYEFTSFSSPNPNFGKYENCDFCCDNYTDKHDRKMKHLYILQTWLHAHGCVMMTQFNIDNYCVYYFITSLLLAPYVKNFQLLLLAKTDTASSVQLLNNDIINHIGSIIRHKCMQLL